MSLCTLKTTRGEFNETWYSRSVVNSTQKFLFGGGGVEDPEAIHVYNLFHFKNYVIKIIS
jgi:hypothetical protein